MTRRATLFLSSLLFPFALSSCQAGLGRAPDALVELYDQASKQGVIELEIDRDGTIREVEAEVLPSALPAAVREAARKRLPGARIISAEREIRAERKAWEVKAIHQNRTWEIVMNAKGEILETEKELQPAETPAPVLDAANRALPGGVWKSIEIIESPGRAPAYHFKKMIEGASYKLVLGADGTIQRKVREARAEIEIPVKG